MSDNSQLVALEPRKVLELLWWPQDQEENGYNKNVFISPDHLHEGDPSLQCVLLGVSAAVLWMLSGGSYRTHCCIQQEVPEDLHGDEFSAY